MGIPLDELVRDLSPCEIERLRSLLGADWELHSLEEIGRQYEETRARIREFEAKAQKLR